MTLLYLLVLMHAIAGSHAAVSTADVLTTDTSSDLKAAGSVSAPAFAVDESVIPRPPEPDTKLRN